MPSGGKRAGAGRKPKPLAEKLEAGNPGHRPLKKMEWQSRAAIEPPEYLKLLNLRFEKLVEGIPSPIEFFERAVRHIEPSGCLHLISAEQIADYAMARVYLVNAQHDLSKTVITGVNTKDEVVITKFTDAMLKLQKNVIDTWSPIWDIIQRNSEVLIQNPTGDIIDQLDGKRARRKSKGVAEYDGFDDSENSGGAD